MLLWWSAERRPDSLCLRLLMCLAVHLMLAFYVERAAYRTGVMNVSDTRTAASQGPLLVVALPYYSKLGRCTQHATAADVAGHCYAPRTPCTCTKHTAEISGKTAWVGREELRTMNHKIYNVPLG
jgi:hypothetical protein